ncbi:aluminum-activated malate transporter 10 [Aegilops tauschii subsp. strangulata]|uniref:Aluminum-activated malate transporter 10 n=1 Tax=Aegilops tauschii subsp. strangulata TaxID=200361 RepID=A0A453CLY9_AEGTS|nr:aluminum-activated malate transporter 10 [Aegilops tauschii subsp. strangulata]
MEMAPATRDGKNGGVPEWRVTVPEGASVTVEHESCRAARAWAWMVSCVVVLGDKVSGFAKRIWKIGADDPRRAVHGLKVGLALALVSVFYYTRPLYDGVGGAAMWAIMTVVVIFEYTVGGCVYKGFNRAAATVSAGAIALGVHWIAANAGHEFEPFIRSGSVFLLASMATFSRFIPTVKARFDYGVTIFILTYSLVAVSGYRVEALLAMAQQRVCTIGIGVFMCLSVCVLICPVWAGQELHRLTVRNMGKLAGAVEACVEDYFAEQADGKQQPPSAGADGYKCVLNSKASEDSQANLARWEPAHGRFGFRHPYEQYKNVGAAMRHCAYCVEALSGCVRSEIQAPEHVKRHLADGCTTVAARCARVLGEAESSVSAMTTSWSLEFAVADMNTAAQELQSDLRELPSKLAEESPATVIDAVQLFTVTSLLIEVSTRVEGVVDAVDTLASLAGFRSADAKPEASETETKVINPDSDEEAH